MARCSSDFICSLAILVSADSRSDTSCIPSSSSAASDLRQPCAECTRLPQLIEVAIRLQQGLDQYIFSILAIAACSHKLAVDGIFMLARKVLKVHVWNRFTAASFTAAS